MFTKIAVRVDTDSGLLGLGDVDDFMGVREARANRRDYFAGHDAFVASALVSEMIYGAEAPKDVMPGGMIAIDFSVWGNQGSAAQRAISSCAMTWLMRMSRRPRSAANLCIDHVTNLHVNGSSLI